MGIGITITIVVSVDDMGKLQDILQSIDGITKNVRQQVATPPHGGSIGGDSLYDNNGQLKLPKHTMEQFEAERHNNRSGTHDGDTPPGKNAAVNIGTSEYDGGHKPKSSHRGRRGAIDMDRAIKLAEQGVNYVEIAERLGHTPKAVYQALSKRGIPFKRLRGND